MNNTVTKAAAFFALITSMSLMSGRANAQIQLNLTGNHFSSAESGASFSDGLWGAELHCGTSSIQSSPLV